MSKKVRRTRKCYIEITYVVAPALVVVDEAVEAAEEPEVEPVAEPVDAALLAVRVTPTDSHVCWANASAAATSSLEQLVSIQVVVEETKDWSLHKQLVSVWLQLPVSALAIHVKAQAAIHSG